MSLYTATILEDTPLLYYRNDEASGTSATDSSGNSRTGTYSGTMTFGQQSGLAEANPGVLFGTTGILVRALDLSALATLSFECWVKVPTYAGSAQIIMEYTPDATAANGYIVDFESAGANLQLVAQGGGFYDIAQYTTPAAGTWHHIMALFNRGASGASATNLYLNGVLQTAIARPLTNTLANPSNSNIYFGSRSGPTLPLNGYMDEIAVYSQVLSASRILAHYNAGKYGRTGRIRSPSSRILSAA